MKKKICAALIASVFLIACSAPKQKIEDDPVTDNTVGAKFILKAPNMMYLSVGPDSSLMANQPDPTKAEVFERTSLGDSKWAVKASNGKYLVDQRPQKDQVFANSNNAWDWETVEIIALDATTVNIKTSQGRFWNIQGSQNALFAAGTNPAIFTMESK